MLWQHVLLCKSYATESAPDCGWVSCVVQREPQHRVNIRKLISECFFLKRDFSKEKCSSMKMILGSKKVGVILNVLM